MPEREKMADGLGSVALLKRLWLHIGRRRRTQFVLLLALMALSTLSEVASLGAVLPFLAVLVSPERLLERPFVAAAAQTLGLSAPSDLVWALTSVFALSAVVAGALRLSVLWASTRLSFAAGLDLSFEAYRRTLYQPYRVHVGRNSSEVVNAIGNKVGATLHVLFQCLTLISALFLLCAVVAALLIIDATIAGVTAGCFAILYGGVTWAARRRLEANGKVIARETTELIKALQEGLGGIRDVLLDGSQPLYCQIYRRADEAARRAQGDNMFVAGAPRFVMEALGMVMIAAIAYGISRQPGGVAAALPVLGAVALGAQRLLPALQQSYAAWSNIAGSRASVADVLAMLEQPIPADALGPAPAPLEFRTEIRFEHVSFRYGDTLPWVIDDLCLTLPRGARIGFVGSTGSGKSTAMDLLMGLIDPDRGQILIDGQPVHGIRRRAWQRAIAHVPQAIFLTDASLAENIAFGVPRASIDAERLRDAVRRAQLADFIEAQAAGYDTIVGERGVRLSGGQRQRIGVARALYRQASVLVFDEATSALDNATERAVMDAIDQLGRDLTILIIAHRLSTVRNCDVIVQLEHGRIAAQGKYNALAAASPEFRVLLAAGA